MIGFEGRNTAGFLGGAIFLPDPVVSQKPRRILCHRNEIAVSGDRDGVGVLGRAFVGMIRGKTWPFRLKSNDGERTCAIAQGKT